MNQARASTSWLPLLVYALGALTLALVVAMAGLSNRPPDQFTRDPLATLGAPPYIGVLSNCGVIGWSAAATVELFAFLLLRDRAAARRERRFLLALAALTTALLIDDLFMVHEVVFPDYLGLDEPVPIAIYAAGFGLIALTWRQVILERTAFPLLGISLLCFGLSIVLDMQAADRGWWPVVEDGLKFMGIVSWLAFIAECSWRWSRADTGDLRGGIAEAGP